MLKKFGNSFLWIQHVQIRLEHISKHFYQKMPSQVTFSGFPASLHWLAMVQGNRNEYSVNIQRSIAMDGKFVRYSTQ